MAQVLVRVFDALDHAHAARDALLAAGIDAGAVALDILNDEAGPVQGNFTVGNTPTESLQHTYERNYAVIRQPAQCILSVAAMDANLLAQAERILAQWGGRDADAAIG